MPHGTPQPSAEDESHCGNWRFQKLPTNERTCKHTLPLIENAARAAELHRDEAHSNRRVTEAELVDVLAHVESHR